MNREKFLLRNHKLLWKNWSSLLLIYNIFQDGHLIDSGKYWKCNAHLFANDILAIDRMHSLFIFLRRKTYSRFVERFIEKSKWSSESYFDLTDEWQSFLLSPTTIRFASRNIFLASDLKKKNKSHAKCSLENRRAEKLELFVHN